MIKKLTMLLTIIVTCIFIINNNVSAKSYNFDNVNDQFWNNVSQSAVRLNALDEIYSSYDATLPVWQTYNFTNNDPSYVSKNGHSNFINKLIEEIRINSDTQSEYELNVFRLYNHLLNNGIEIKNLNGLETQTIYGVGFYNELKGDSSTYPNDYFEYIPDTNYNIYRSKIDNVYSIFIGLGIVREWDGKLDINVSALNQELIRIDSIDYKVWTYDPITDVYDFAYTQKYYYTDTYQATIGFILETEKGYIDFLTNDIKAFDDHNSWYKGPNFYSFAGQNFNTNINQGEYIKNFIVNELQSYVENEYSYHNLINAFIKVGYIKTIIPVKVQELSFTSQGQTTQLTQFNNSNYNELKIIFNTDLFIDIESFDYGTTNGDLTVGEIALQLGNQQVTIFLNNSLAFDLQISVVAVPNTITVQFITHNNNNPEPYSILSGETLPSVPTPFLAGYTFVGWATDSRYSNVKYYIRDPFKISRQMQVDIPYYDNDFIKESPITTSTVYYAVFEKPIYYVKLDTRHSYLSTQCYDITGKIDGICKNYEFRVVSGYTIKDNLEFVPIKEIIKSNSTGVFSHFILLNNQTFNENTPIYENITLTPVFRIYEQGQEPNPFTNLLNTFGLTNTQSRMVLYLLINVLLLVGLSRFHPLIAWVVSGIVTVAFYVMGYIPLLMAFIVALISYVVFLIMKKE